MSGALIGLDIGTSSIKAAAFDEHGNQLTGASAPVSVISPHAGWAEQQPEDWWQGTCSVLRQISERIDPRTIIAIGLSGQCPGHVLIDRHHQAIGRAIIWRDQRAAQEATWLKQHISPEQARAWTGSAPASDATSPPARLLWISKHRAADLEQSVAVLQPKDFIACKLTGNIITDRHSAYSLYDPLQNRYHPEYFDALAFPIEKMPAVRSPVETAGELSPSASSQTGLPQGTRLVVGTIDAYCDNLAGGITSPGRAVDVAGTSESVSLSVEHSVDAPGIYPACLEDGGCFLCGPTQSGGDTLRWLAKCFYPEFAGGVDFQTMEQEAGAVSAGCNGLTFLPYLAGERAPIWDSAARGSFIGLTFDHTRPYFTRAVYESIGFAIRHILALAENAAGYRAEHLVVCGGGSRSQFWNQIKADILQRPVMPTAITETGCLGAAMLASVGAGIHPDLYTASDQMIIFRDRVDPDIHHKDAYDQAYQAYRQYYPALKPIWSSSGTKE
ncbi:MAG: hypothetical protein HPY76_05580 [Anaerolineae bacterium]|nr:hypothetical protein [Anaerolineae bacterium]